MNQMRCRAKIVRKILVLHGCHAGGCTKISILTNQLVDREVLSKLFHSGSQHNQLRSIRQRHPRPVNRLVPQPGAMELIRVKENHRLLNRLIEQNNIYFQTELRGFSEAFLVVADEQTTSHQSSILISRYNRQDINDW